MVLTQELRFPPPLLNYLYTSRSSQQISLVKKLLAVTVDWNHI